MSGDQIDALIHPHLKELLSFAGSNELVGEIKEDSLEERLYQARKELGKTTSYTKEEIDSALITLGLNSSSTIEDAKEIWLTNLIAISPAKLVHQGPSFVTAGLEKAKLINDAYCLLVQVDKNLQISQSKKNEIEILEAKRKREEGFKSESLDEEILEAFSK